MQQYVYERHISGTDYYIWMGRSGAPFSQTDNAPYEDAEGMCLKLQLYST